jgi:hypothetical protein
MLRILFIARCDMLDYQSDGLLHGLLGRTDVEMDFLTMGPRQFARRRFKEIENPFWYLFNDASEPLLRSQYGRGFTLYGRLAPLGRKINTTNVWFELLRNKYDLVVYAALHRNATLLPLISKLYGNRVVVIDGDDKSDLPILPRSFCGNKFKRELESDDDGWKPISFAIPSTLVVGSVPVKTQTFAGVVPGTPGDHKAYRYDDEESYYGDYRRSVYGRTRKKGGWDCLRHYEILMNGCIPHFEDLDKCPKPTLTTFPKGMVKRLKELGLVHSDVAHTDEILSLLDWTKQRCTTASLAQYVLESSIQ